MPQRRKTAPEARWTTLCAKLTWKMPSSISLLVAAGTKPRMPTSKKTKPKRIAAVFTIVTSYWVKRPHLWQSRPHWQAQNRETKKTLGCLRSTTMKRYFALLLITFALIADLTGAPESAGAKTKTAVFAGGCFWCIQPAFDKATGVIKTVVGYCGGTEPNPTYELVGSEKTKYRESIEITYDPAKISFDRLLDIYWQQIDPTQADGQFTDIGPSYRAAIFYGDNEEKKIAEASKEKLAQSGKFDKPIATEILPLMKFYPAEAYHQKYYQQNPEHFEAFEKGSGRVSFQKQIWRDGQ